MKSINHYVRRRRYLPSIRQPRVMNQSVILYWELYAKVILHP
ncbi:MAG: hypothetical protein BECKG1743D_GA0114223_103541 [Candidatus Kentron sp. G]|nr:MAG: hypothetical protein BECKG1743F_GA0114225_100282 [Candidatus Kentron sp. G]VFM95876.1 MAG: hypothetical protein BECKG1743E_GA0114224_100241 [Candidatus Kentron sp. G]VFN02306.1 MAG: hypothetical protein BECKG1743D_GA0114223_103541 [Candidatus Kentron sp. G]